MKQNKKYYLYLNTELRFSHKGIMLHAHINRSLFYRSLFYSMIPFCDTTEEDISFLYSLCHE